MNTEKSCLYPETLQYLMGYSEIGVTLNTFTHLGLEDAVDEMKKLEEVDINPTTDYYKHSPLSD